MTALADAAARYASAGWSIFRLAKGSSKPLKGTRGFHEATADPAQVQAWWAEDDYNIGLATGSASGGVVVVDLDTPDAGRGLDLPPTAWARTPHGFHLYYHSDQPVRRAIGKLAPKVDVLGERGYVVLPPSVKAEGAYVWGEQRWPLTPLPQWIHEALARDEQPAAVGLEQMRAGATSAWGEAVLRGELAKILAAPEGRRNDTLNTSAFLVFGAVKAGHLDLDTARDSMLRAAIGAGLTDFEARRTLQSAWDAAKPRKVELKVEKPPERREVMPPPQPPGARRLLSIEDLATLPPPEWIVPGLPRGALTVFHGDSETGKTFTALDWCLYAASQGHRVVYGAGEGVSGLYRRISAWRKVHPQHDPAGNFHVLEHSAFPNLLDPQAAAALRNDLLSLDPPPSVLVIDTLSNALVGGSDSSDQDVRTAYYYLKMFANEWGLASLIIHHDKKTVAGSGPQPYRGSSVIRNDCDFMWQFYRFPDGTVRMTNGRTKEWEPLPPMNFWLQSVELDETGEDGEPLYSAVVTPSIVDGA